MKVLRMTDAEASVVRAALEHYDALLQDQIDDLKRQKDDNGMKSQSIQLAHVRDMIRAIP
jgi:hypothetical protein